MAVTSKNFGNAPDGAEVTLYTIKNSKGFIAEVTNFGAILVNLLVPDKDGTMADVVLGFDKVDGYFGNGSFFGSTIGPSANRIDNASMEIDGVAYQLKVNDGTNNLHSDEADGYHKRVWNAEPKDNCVVFTLEDNASMGFPGNKKVQVTYTVTDENELKIEYHVTSDKPTLINMTNHTYFNLSGHDSGSIENHRLYIDAFHYTPVYERLIPTGALVPVEGTPFDFRTMKTIGDEIDTDDVQLTYGQGYDHNFAIDNWDGSIRKVAEVQDPASGRKMVVYTDQPGLQFYAGNCINEEVGKENAAYGPRKGFCLETQYYPDNIHHPEFPQSVFGPGKDYESVTIYQFI